MGNALAGFAAIVELVGLGHGETLDERLRRAALLIVAAMLCDALDGLAARATRTASAFGARLDALADTVSFGVAPAVLVMALVGASVDGDAARRVGVTVAMLYLAAALLRLARFQVERPGTAPSPDAPRSFRGLPSPGAAAVVFGVAVAWPELFVAAGTPAPEKVPGTFSGAGGFPGGPAGAAAWGTAVAASALLAAGLMVSRLRYPHAVTRGLRRRARFGQLVGVAAALACAVLWPWLAAAAGAGAYAVWGPATAVGRRLRRRRSRRGRPGDESPALD